MSHYVSEVLLIFGGPGTRWISEAAIREPLEDLDTRAACVLRRGVRHLLRRDVFPLLSNSVLL